MKRLKKVLVTVLLTLVMVYSVPMNVLAENKDEEHPDRYVELTNLSYVSVIKDAHIHVYITKDAADVSLVDSLVDATFAMETGRRVYEATAKDGWIWKGWAFEQIFEGQDKGNRTDETFILFEGLRTRYSFSNKESQYVEYKNERAIRINRLRSMGEYYWSETLNNQISYNIYANLNPTITASAGEGGTITNSGVTEVNYGGSQTYSTVASVGMAISSLEVNGVEVTEAVGKTQYTYEFTDVTSPQTITVSFGNTYKVTYTDGVEEEEIFADEIHEGLLSGTATPAFNGTPLRLGYVFNGWNPKVADTVAGDAIYTATWAEDKNNNGIADDEETKCTVTYKDGVGGEAFEDQVYENLLHNFDKIPEFRGTPSRKGYLFKGWDPEIDEEVVTKDLTFTATWEKIETKPEKPVTPSSKPSSKPIDPCTERIGTGWVYDEVKGYCVYKGSGQVIPNTSVK